ncbi:MAG: ATP-dependent helicase [Anaerolineae bacterium]
MSEIKLRETQESVVSYAGGKMGVSAVPGAGKTTTLSYLAAALVERLTAQGVVDNQEVLIVTLTNSAVNAFRGRIARIVQQERGLLPYIGYRVRTLHSLAHDIVRMRPGLVGLSENFDIVDERVTSGIIDELATAWIRTSGETLVDYVDLPNAETLEQKVWQIRRHATDLIRDIAYETIRLAKDNLWEPDEMRERLKDLPPTIQPALAEVGIEMYENYQRALQIRGAVDFDDLVRLAMQALRADDEFLQRLRRRWVYILEDEAQDSSQLQERMLSLLAGDEGNWVRVGDPNQSIYTTFTTADANLLVNFLRRPDVESRPLPVSGRSSQAIIDLANRLVEWSNTDELIPHLHGALTQQPRIEPTGPDDPQQNPGDGLIHIDWDGKTNITPEREINRIVQSIERWLPEHPDWTVAVLVPANTRGFKVAEALRERSIPYEVLLRSTSATRSTAYRLYRVLSYLSDPTEARQLARLFDEVWWPVYVEVDEALDDRQSDPAREWARDQLRQLSTVERYLWPGPEGDWLDALDEATDDVIVMLDDFRTQIRLWLEAATLPIDQLILPVSLDQFTNQADLALAHKLAVVLKGIARSNQDYRIAELSRELRVIADNARRFIGFDEAASGYEPRPGVVTIATMHAAKGLEWDRVYLMSVSTYDFPTAQPGDSFIAEKWFIRDDLNIPAEARRQIELIMAGRPGDYVEGQASREAREAYAAERLRLLYVGITRARRDLILTWNMGRFWNRGRENRPAQAMIALKGVPST